MYLDPVEGFYNKIILNGGHKGVGEELCPEMTKHEDLWLSGQERRYLSSWSILSASGFLVPQEKLLPFSPKLAEIRRVLSDL